MAKKLFHFALYLCILLMAAPLADAQKKKKKKAKKEKKKKKDKVGKDGLTKKERKEWKKRRKKLKPAQYKALMDEYYGLKEQISNSESSIAEYEAQIGEQEKAIGKYKKETTDLRKKLDAKPKVVSSGKATDAFAKGVVFRIQIGAYEGIDLSQYKSQKNFKVENNGSMQKFTIGEFREYRSADDLKKYLQKMGVSDAWVVAYRDGQRVEISEVTGGG